MSKPLFESHDTLMVDPDMSIQVWHSHLDGLSVGQIADWVGFTPTKVTKILSEAPPLRIARDLRYRTGQKAFAVKQSGRDSLMGPDGLPRTLVLLSSHKITTAAYRKGLDTIEAELRDGTDGDVRVGQGVFDAALEMHAALELVHERGAPAWEIDAEGNIRKYDGRHARLLIEPLPMPEVEQEPELAPMA